MPGMPLKPPSGALPIFHSGPAVELTWPVYPRAFFLQSATSTSGVLDWQPENASLSVNGNTNTARFVPGDGLKLFRLAL